MSGLSDSIPPRSLSAPDRQPVENCTIRPGQCWRRPASSRPNFSGSEDGVSSSLRTCTCASVAPASNASCVDSTCSAIVIGTAGLSALRGSEPVMATEMMHGWDMGFSARRLGLWRLARAAACRSGRRLQGTLDRRPGLGLDLLEGHPRRDLDQGERTTPLALHLEHTELGDDDVDDAGAGERQVAALQQLVLVAL